MKILPALLILLPCLTIQAQAQEQLHLCQDEIPEAPWRTLGNDGLNTIMLKELGRQLNLAIRIENLSWKRCLLMVQQGLLDGAIAASFRPERLQIGAYPTSKEGLIPDRNRRMSGEAYYIYKLAEDPFNWDGNTFSGNRLPIAAPMGYSAVGRLQEKGVRVDDRDRKPEQLLRKVEAGMVSAAVLARGEGEKWLKTPRFANKIVRLPIPFYQTAGYLMLSHALTEKNPGLAERIWDGIATIRTSPAYRKELIRHGQSPDD